MPSKSAASVERSTNIFGEGLAKLPSPVFQDRKHHLKIFQGDCLEILAAIPEECVDLIFADPPYFLSNNGITCHAGRMVSVNKGKWDKSRGPDLDHEFNRAWLVACQRVLKPNGSIWVSGTSHVIHSVPPPSRKPSRAGQKSPTTSEAQGHGTGGVRFSRPIPPHVARASRP